MSSNRIGLRPPARVSAAHLLVFALVFGLLGIVLWQSMAAPNPNLQGDLNGDNVVDASDLSILLSDFNTTKSEADINGDGTVDVLDLSYILSNYGQTYSASPTFASETDFTAPSFTPTRTIDVYNQTDFMTAWNNIQPGDQINVHGVTFTGEVSLTNKNLSDWAQISFDSGTKFVGVSTATNDPPVYIENSSHIRFYGGDVSDSASSGQAGFGILVHEASYITWWNFVIHDTGNTGLGVFPAEGPISNLDFKGEIYDWGLNTAWDPHAEKGSGEHGANISDSNYALTNSRFALYVHDGPAGAGLEIGSDTASSTGNTIYLWCQNLTFVSLSQTGGNCVNVWGANTLNNTFAYIEAENLQGRAYDANGVYSGQSLSTDTVEYGRASDTNLNASLEDGTLPGVVWDSRGGTVFQDVSPTP